MPDHLIYFVETQAEKQRVLLCRWIERFYERGRKVQVVVDSSQAAQYIDHLLWTFSEESFIPHRIAGTGGGEAGSDPVVITVGESRLDGFDVLVCDGSVQFEFMSRFPEVVHFVLTDDSEKKQESRLMWQRAREKGFHLRHVSKAEGLHGPPAQ